MWLKFCCARRNSHIIQQRFFCFFGEISPTGDKKNAVRPVERIFFEKLPEHSPYFLEKKEKN
jgi:hypothetical protein